jgi:two-component system cell cycle response regulator
MWAEVGACSSNGAEQPPCNFSRIVALPTRQPRALVQLSLGHVTCSTFVTTLASNGRPWTEGARLTPSDLQSAGGNRQTVRLEGRSPRPLILVVDDDAATRSALLELLEDEFHILTASDGVEAMALTRAHLPEVVLADLSMPRLGGMGLLELLQSDPRTQDVPVVFFSAQDDPRTVVDCFSHGAADFVPKPGRPEELRARLQRHLEQARRVTKLESLALTDALTGLHNYRAFQARIAEELARAARYTAPLALLLVDLDELKLVNDRRGHEAGSAALCAVANVFREELREVDFAARFGGDEFVALLPHQTAAEAAVVAERLRARTEARPWPWPEPLSVSIGVAAVESTTIAHEAAALLAAADAALYRSKRKGRNRVEVAGPEDGPHETH